jgi:hypothetical protein
MKRSLAGLTLLITATVMSGGVGGAENGGLSALKFLEGKWVGEGSSEAGKGGGYATFEEDLQGKVMVRRNHAEYPAAEGRPAYVHDDLMVIYPDTGTKGLRAFYTDNEGHVIHYSVSVSADGNVVTLLGDADGSAPRYRLSYTTSAADKMSILLEMAQGAGEASFHKIVEGKMIKVATGKAPKAPAN